MRKYFTVAWLLLPFYTLFAQLITTSPVVPQVDQAVTLTFDATLGTGGLADCNCDVYLHTGVITNLSTGPSDWRYVPTQWGVANPDWQLTPVPGEDNKYTYTYSPSIIEYFNVPDGETVEQLAFVFRNADGTLEGKASGGNDIFVDIAPPGGVLSLNLLGDPGPGAVQPLGETLSVVAGSSIPADLSLFDNGVEVASFEDVTSAQYDFVFTDVGTHEIRLDALSPDGQTATTSFIVDAAIAINWQNPSEEVLILAGPTVDFTFEASTFDAANIELSLDGQTASGQGNTSLNVQLTEGLYTAIATVNYQGTITESSRVVVVGGPTVEDPPAGFNNGITRIDGGGLYLQLFAEGKTDIYVIGNFNDWSVADGGRMKRSVDGDIFWIELTDLPADEDVIFQYLVDYNIRVADPYSELVLDAFNDPFIPESVFPNIPAYPGERTSGIVSWVRMNTTDFEWTDGDFEPIEAEKLTIYELLVRDFLEDHSYASLLDTLDYLQRLGVNAIELMPVNEFEGNISWGYNPSFHMALDKYYGTPEALKAVINECHERGMSVILDVVYNHAFSQASVAQMWWDPIAFQPTPDNPYLNVVATHPFSVGYDFNHESPATKDYVKTSLRYWLEEFHFDGFRFDLSKGFTQNDCGSNGGCAFQYDPSRIAILTDYADEVWNTNQNALVILEHFAASQEEDEMAQYGNGIYFWSGFNPHDEYLEASMGYPSNLNDVLAENRGFTTGDFLVAYMESHDEERMQYKNEQFGNSAGNYNVTNPETGYNRVQLASAFFYTLPGPKMLWQFGELGYDFPINYCPNGTVDPGCRVDPKPIRWDYAEENGRADIYNLIRSLLNVRNNYEVFHTDNYDVSLTGTGKRIHLFGDDGLDAVILGNFDVEATQIQEPFPYAGTWYDYITTEQMAVAVPTQPFSLQPGEFRIFFNQEIALPEPGLPTEVREVSVAADAFKLKLTPNPNQGQFQLSYKLPTATDVSVQLLDQSGRNLGQELVSGVRAAGLQTESLNVDLPAGFYFLRLRAGHEVSTLKVIIQ